MSEAMTLTGKVVFNHVTKPDNRKIDFDRPKIYNVDKEEVGVGHLSLYGDTVSMRVKQGKGDYSEYTYLEAIRVEEKADGVEDFDPSEF